jgi:ribosomal protein L44E
MAPRVAKDIVSYCTSCRMDLVHTIVAVHGDRVVRVLCRTCKKEHAFRLPAEQRVSATKKHSAKSPSPRKGRSAGAEWEAAMERIRELTAKRYALDVFCEAGEKVDHPVFGLGRVERLISPDKMEVLFEEGVKLLVRGNAHKASG